MCLIPGTELACESFPALLRIYDLSATPQVVAEISFHHFGQIKEFTVFSDLEKGVIRVSGFLQEGYFHYHIVPLTSGFTLRFLKVPPTTPGRITIESKKYCYKLPENGTISSKESVSFVLSAQAEEKQIVLPERERVSFGNHKAQDIEMILRRGDLTEILPLWYLLSQSIPALQNQNPLSASSLFSQVQEAVDKKDVDTIYNKLLALFQAGFKSLLYPTLTDDFHQGFEVPTILDAADASPLVLLEKSYPLLRALFLQEEAGKLHILPVLAQQFHCGKIVNLATKQVGRVSLEWTKKMIRRVIIDAAEDCEMKFVFQSDVKRFRFSELTTHKLLGFLQADALLSFQKGKRYLIDRFEK